MADRHYTRQRPGHPMWTRPGYNLCLIDERERALFCWWRPKWEAGLERKDKMRVLECTMFRNEDPAYTASDLIRSAVDFLDKRVAAQELHLSIPSEYCLITGVGAPQTQKRRSKRHLPGHCFRMAGWVPFDHNPGKADVWLMLPGEIPPCELEQEAQCAS